MNPYAVFLAGQDARAVIASTAARLNQLAAGAAGRCSLPPAPGKWSIREILCHLADTELVFAFRLRQALAEPHHVIQPFDQDRWAANYQAYSTASALSLFKTVRDWNLKLLDTVDESCLDHPVSHPERGVMTFRTLIETMAGHDLNHIRQIEAIAACRATA